MRLAASILIFVVFAAVLSVIAWLDGGVIPYPLPGGLVAERAAERLTGASCASLKGDEKEYRLCLAQSAPIGAYASYRRCGGYIESERVGVSRIACSKPELLEDYVQFGEGRTAYREFRRACRAHDFCYLHSMSTYDPRHGDYKAQQRCDKMLLADAVRDCRLLFPKESDNLRKCRWAAMATYAGVRLRGHEYFAKWNQAACDYEPGPHGARDQVVAGRFVPGGPDGVVAIMEDAESGSLMVEYSTLDDNGGAVRQAVIEGLSPAGVAAADSAAACLSPPWTDAGRSCPQTLGEAGLKAADWLRFAPVVVDSDGDGAEEIVLVALIPEAGLVFTHLKLTKTEETVAFAPPQGYFAFNGFKEFWSATREVHAPLSDDRPIQMLSHEFVAVQRTPDGRCAAHPESGPEDIVLLGGRAEAGRLAIAHRMYRFAFDPAANRWSFIRDQFIDDRHKMRYCDKEAVGSFSQGTRLQYPAIVARGPVKCGGRTIDGETLTAVVREKCPSSTISARAGELNDIDLVHYRINPAFTGGPAPEDDPLSELNSARVSWQPIIWNEAADPVLTSKYARRLGVMLVSAYTGGTSLNRYPLVNVLHADQRTRQATKEDWRERQPDTLGLSPVQYAIFESDRFAPVQTWNNAKFGDAAMFSHIPSILAPFWTDGTPGLSLLMFANRASFERDNVARPVDTGGGSDPLKRGALQILMVPLSDKPAEEKPRLPSNPRWLECEVPQGGSLAAPPARPLLRWRSDFLYQEPVLPGRFFTGEKGGLAIAYRTAEGRLSFTTLQNRPDGDARDTWWLGGRACKSLSAAKPDGSAPDRHVWMMRLN